MHFDQGNSSISTFVHGDSSPTETDYSFVGIQHPVFGTVGYAYYTINHFTRHMVICALTPQSLCVDMEPPTGPGGNSRQMFSANFTVIAPVYLHRCDILPLSKCFRLLLNQAPSCILLYNMMLSPLHIQVRFGRQTVW
jgi:hypothetical protein